jgi:hypothetical protein
MQPPNNKKLLIIPGILCGLLWWYGLALSWVMLAPVLWIVLTPGESKMIDIARLFGISAVTFMLSVPMAFYLFIPYRWGGDILGALLAISVVVSVALADRARTPSMWSKPWWRNGLAAVLALIVLLTLYTYVSRWVSGTDTRNQAKEWITANLEPGAVVVVPMELSMDVEPLQDRCHIVPVTVSQLRKGTLTALTATWQESYLIAPSWRVLGPEPAIRRAAARWELFTREAEKKAAFEGGSVPANSLHPVRVKEPGIGIYRFQGNKDAPGVTVLHPWRPLKQNPEKTAPALRSLGMRGTFILDYKKQDGRNILTVTNSKAGDKGERICQIGFAANKRGLVLPLEPGAYIHFIVQARVPAHLAKENNENNHVFIQDYNGAWERKTIHFNTGGWMTGLVSKRIRHGSSRMNMGVRFQPESGKDKLSIKDVYIVVEKQE